MLLRPLAPYIAGAAILGLIALVAYNRHDAVRDERERLEEIKEEREDAIENAIDCSDRHWTERLRNSC